MTTYTEGRRSSILRRVQFEFGYQYIGFNRFCRVLLIPALGSTVANTDRTELRYVTYQKDLWHLIFLQTGFCYQILEPLKEYDPVRRLLQPPQPVKGSDLPQYVDIDAFQWRRQQTNALWVNHPLDNFEMPAPDEPFAFPYDLAERVYFIEAETLDRVRIGWTGQPAQRPQRIAPYVPAPIRYLAVLPGGRDDEEHLFFALSHLRLHRDWFHLNDEMRAYIRWAKANWRKPGEWRFCSLKDFKKPIGANGVPVE